MLQSRETIPFWVVNHAWPQSSVDTDTSHKDRIASSFPLYFTKSIIGTQKTVFHIAKKRSLVQAWKVLLRSFFGTIASTWECGGGGVGGVTMFVCVHTHMGLR